MSGLTAGILRSMLAGAIAVAIAFSLRLPFPKSAPDRTLLFVSGKSSFCIWPTLLSIGIEHTTAGHAALIMALMPIYTVSINSILNRRIPKFGWWIGAAFALGATVALILSRGMSIEASGDGYGMMGDLIILAGGVIGSIGYVAGGKLSPKIGTAATTFWGLSMALVVLLPVFISIAGGTEWGDVPINGWIAIAWMTFLASLAGYALWFYALGKGGISRIGSLPFLMSVITLTVAALMLGKTLTIQLAGTCAAIIGGTMLTQRYVT